MVAPGGQQGPLARAVARAEYGARLSSLAERLLAGGAERALAQHEPAVYSNESEVLRLHSAELLEGQQVVEGHAHADHKQQAEQQQPQPQALQLGGELPAGNASAGSGSSSSDSSAGPVAAAAPSGRGRGRLRGSVKQAIAAAAPAKPRQQRKPRSGSSSSSDGRPSEAAVAQLLEGLSQLEADNMRFLLEQGVGEAEAARLQLQLANCSVDLRTRLPAVLSLLGGEFTAPQLLMLLRAPGAVLAVSPEELRSRLDRLKGAAQAGQQPEEAQVSQSCAGVDGAAAGSRPPEDSVDGQLLQLLAVLQQRTAQRQWQQQRGAARRKV